ncbi:AEC family transporter [Virgibacillus halophilus]|uniref:AEC family transporter n=2 Tax=Tigheibacillus halophilus TaxID=361280 RepID=A0ABU5C462_9BACI|nr:AEC family transporter [Virgibacillus halophilus]
MPVLYALLAGILCNVLDVPLPEFIWVPANYIAEGMISVALLTLGAQVANLRLTAGLSKVTYSLLLRLMGGPIIAFVIIKLFGMEGVIAQALLIASAMPTSVNSSVIAQEYDNHPALAAQIVLFSTLISSITVTLTIYFARLFL